MEEEITKVLRILHTANVQKSQKYYKEVSGF